MQFVPIFPELAALVKARLGERNLAHSPTIAFDTLKQHLPANSIRRVESYAGHDDVLSLDLMDIRIDNRKDGDYLLQAYQKTPVGEISLNIVFQCENKTGYVKPSELSNLPYDENNLSSGKVSMVLGERRVETAHRYGEFVRRLKEAKECWAQFPEIFHGYRFYLTKGYQILDVVPRPSDKNLTVHLDINSATTVPELVNHLRSISTDKRDKRFDLRAIIDDDDTSD